ncbi:MAG: peptide-methionine (S)-S-oxide reductase MsrA [Aequorivita sp.]
MENKNLEQMTVGGGCFWCTDAVFDQVKGVEKIVSGYSGGTVPGIPTYREICSGLTGHAEVIQVSFDPAVVSFEDLVVIFMTSHDPTTLNRQGADRGTQYRSVIFYHDETQKQIAEAVLKAMTPYYENPIVTEISPLEKFYPADGDHQAYYANNPSARYCTAVISPKLARLRQMHADKLKSA